VFEGTERFEIIRRLGTGGMGAVYEAFDRERQLPVALKLLNLRHPEALMRFKNEFRALQAVHHPNLVSLGELFARGEQWFFTMELVRGTDLVSHIRNDAEGKLRFDTPRLRAAFHQLALGLAALHRHGHIHRDVKPSNVLVGRDNRVVLLDFGLVREPGKSLDTSPDVVVGTPEYMSPEQAMGDDLAPSSDWYSLGVILYEALVGATPFVGTPMQVMMAKTRTDPAPPHLRVADVPEDLSALCMALLRRDPHKRPNENEILKRFYVELRRDDRTWLTLPLHPTAERFVGRREPLAQLDGAFRDAVQSGVRLAFVTGGWGIGKTALVRELALRLAGDVHGPLVWSSRCHERESIPFKAVDMLLDDAARFLLSLPAEELGPLLPEHVALLARTFPSLMRVPTIAERPPGNYDALEPEARRRVLFTAARELFRAIARVQPLVVIVEDLQWGDADGLSLLHDLLQAPGDEPVLFVGTLRTEQAFALAPAALVDGLDNSRISWLHLDPLSSTEMMELVQALLPGVEQRDVRRIVAQASGHPLFAHELCLTKDVHALRLGDALRARIEPLEAEAHAVLDVLAVAESALPQSLVGDIAGLPWSEAERAITHLRAAQLARTVGLRRTDLVEVAHDRVRDAVRAALLGPALRNLHERIAATLAQYPRASVEVLASHWLGAGRSAEALSCLVAGAAEAAQALAFERALSLYNRAIDLCDDDRARARIEARAQAIKNAAR
jgi:eukaryotic-like serine/threonine-protein kinase